MSLLPDPCSQTWFTNTPSPSPSPGSRPCLLHSYLACKPGSQAYVWEPMGVGKLELVACKPGSRPCLPHSYLTCIPGSQAYVWEPLGVGKPELVACKPGSQASAGISGWVIENSDRLLVNLVHKRSPPWTPCSQTWFTSMSLPRTPCSQTWFTNTPSP